MDKIYYIVLRSSSGSVVLTKKQYSDWKEVQNDYSNYATSLGPWSKEDLISYLKDDFKSEEDWTFSKKEIEDFFASDEQILTSKR